MNETELELTEMLRDRASRVPVLPPMDQTLRRTKVRRVTNVATALLSLVALIGVSVAGMQTFVRDGSTGDADILRPTTTTDGSYGFGSTEGQYPTIARGEFRGATWELTGTAGESEYAPRVNMRLTITTDAGSVVDEVAVQAGDDMLIHDYVTATEQLGGAHVVFGGIQKQVASVEVVVADGNETVIPVHRFSDYDSRSSIAADYFLAFVPGDSPGFVHARDELGIDLESATYGPVTQAPHVVASGKTGDANWSLEFAAVEKDRVCLVFAPVEGGSKCFTRAEIEGADPLLVATFDLEDVYGVVAIISNDVSDVRLARDGLEPMALRWFQPPDEDRAEWPLRLVAVGLPPGTQGFLQAYDGEGGGPLFEERF